MTIFNETSPQHAAGYPAAILLIQLYFLANLPEEFVANKGSSGDWCMVCFKIPIISILI